MAVIQIPNLPIAISIDGQELLECVQGGVTRRINVAQIWNGFRSRYAYPPTTVTSDYSVADNDDTIICNGSGIITLNLPSTTSNVGRILNIKTISNFNVISLENDVAPIDSSILGNFILSGSAGKWATLQCDGSSWITIASNN